MFFVHSLTTCAEHFSENRGSERPVREFSARSALE
jgi:hypothetical protein